jgi:hypothetical protein
MLAAIVAISAINKPPNYVINPKPENSRAANEEGQKSPDEGVKQAVYFGVFTPSDTLAQWIAAVAALGSVGVSIWAVRLVSRSLKETRKATSTAITSNRIAREIGEAQARAYIQVRQIAFHFNAKTKVLKISGFVENSGQTPARETSIAIAFFFGWDPFPEGIHKYNGAEKPMSKMSIATGVAIPLKETATEISADAMDMAQFGEGKIWCFGVVRYIDVFKRPQFTRFRAEYDPKLGTNKRSPSIVCPDGNEAS